MRALFLLAVLFLLAHAADEKESNTTKSALPEDIEAEIIPVDKLCTVCHFVIGRMKQQQTRDAEQFKTDLITSCMMADKPDEARKCREAITDVKMETLKTSTTEEICVDQKLCKEGEAPDLAASPPGTAPLEEIPALDRPKLQDPGKNDTVGAEENKENAAAAKPAEEFRKLYA